MKNNMGSSELWRGCMLGGIERWSAAGSTLTGPDSAFQRAGWRPVHFVQGAQHTMQSTPATAVQCLITLTVPRCVMLCFAAMAVLCCAMQMGTDLHRLQSALDFVQQMVQQLSQEQPGFKAPELLGSVFLPSKRLLAQMKFRWVALKGRCC